VLTVKDHNIDPIMQHVYLLMRVVSGVCLD